MEIANEKKIAGLVQFLRKGRTMTGRFRLPMLEEQAYEYLLAAYIMEVQLRYRRFIYNGFVEEQLKQVANCLTANTAKFGIVLCGGCGNGKTTMLKALQNLVRRLEILKPNLSPNAGHSSDNYYSFKPRSPILQGFGVYFLTSSLRTPKIFAKEFSYFLMSCHQHCLGINLLVQR